jgi:branched-chain amino acid transport system ATP-binding protein
MTTLLKVSNVGVRFGGLAALSGVSFKVSAGEIVGLIGPNGAGKTTLFSTLVGLQKPTTGEIFLRSERIDGKRPHKIATAGMTKTFQNTALFPGMTLLDNVITAALLRHSVLVEAKRYANECVVRVGLGSAAHTDVDDLTFPQKALGEVARALATRPQVLLLDEVMAALTPLEMDGVMNTLRDLVNSTGLTLIVVEHHMRVIMKLCQRLLVLNFGKLIADGTPEDVARDRTVIEAYLGSEHAQTA